MGNLQPRKNINGPEIFLTSSPARGFLIPSSPFKPAYRTPSEAILNFCLGIQNCRISNVREYFEIQRESSQRYCSRLTFTVHRPFLISRGTRYTYSSPVERRASHARKYRISIVLHFPRSRLAISPTLIDILFPIACIPNSLARRDPIPLGDAQVAITRRRLVMAPRNRSPCFGRVHRKRLGAVETHKPPHPRTHTHTRSSVLGVKIDFVKSMPSPIRRGLQASSAEASFGLPCTLVGPSFPLLSRKIYTNRARPAAWIRPGTRVYSPL